MRQNTFYYLSLAFLCVSIVHIRPASARQASVEVIAISKANASFDAQNLALEKAKGAILHVPSNEADGARLIDGNPTGGWRAAEEFNAARPVEIVIRLKEKSEVAQVYVQPKNWRPGSRIPKEVEILLSLTGPDSGFESVGRFTLHKKKAWQRLSFESRKAGYLKLRIHSLYRDGRPGIGEIAVFGPGAGPSKEVSNESKTIENKPEISSILVNHEAQNKAIRFGVHTYKLVDQFLGNPAPDKSQFLIIRGFLGNKSAKLQTSIPNVQKAFFLRLAGNETINLHPISNKTTNPFWGPIILKPGEELPVEMVFVVPARPLEHANLMHLSNMGPINLYIIGEAPALPSTYLAGPVDRGQTKIAIERIDFDPSVSVTAPPKGWRYVKVYFWFTNLRELQPFETDLAGLVVLVEDGSYVYPPVAESRKRKLPQGETFYAQQPTPGEMVFLIPEKTGDLAFVHFTEDGPLALDLTPDIGGLVPQKPIAGPVGERSISLSLFQPQHAIQLETPKSGFRYVVLDVGLRLNTDSPIASFAFKPATSLELHDSRGRFYKPEKVDNLRRPLGPSDLWRDQIVRGEVAFLVPESASTFTLMIPFKAGPTRLSVPEALISHSTTIVAQKRLPAHPISTDREVSKSERPSPKAREKETTKEISLPKRTIQEELVHKGYKDLLVVVKDNGVTVVIGIVKSNKEIDDVSSIISSFQKAKEVKIHISTVPAQKMHPLKLKNWAELAMKTVGLNDVQLRVRKKDELILLGTVANNEEEELALSIARILVKDVVNLLKKKY